MASRLPGVNVDRAASDLPRGAGRALLGRTLGDARFRVLAVVVGAIALLHRDGVAGPKAVYLAVAAAAVIAAIPSAARLRRDGERIAEWRMVLTAGTFGLVVVLSLPVALAHGNGVVAWVRDASVYGLIAAAPLLAIDLRRRAGLRWVRWLLVASGATCAASFVVEWVALRGYADLPIDTILLPSLYLPAGLLAYATARGIRRSPDSALWWALAGAIVVGIALSGTRTSVILVAAPLVQLALPGRRRLLAVVVPTTAVALGVAIVLANELGLDRGRAIERLTSATTFLRDPTSDPSWAERADQTADALDAWRASPIAGVGPGHLFHWNDFYGVPRSSFLVDTPASYLAKFGLVGVLVLVLFVVALVQFLRTRLREEDETRTGAEALLGFSAIAAFGFVLGVPLEDKGFPLALLLLTALALPGQPDPRVSPARLRRTGALVACLVLVGCAAGAVAGRSTSSTAAALRELPSIVNVESRPVGVISRFEYALWAGDGARACRLLTSVRLARYGTRTACIRVLSRHAQGSPLFARSRATGPLVGGDGLGLEFVIRRQDGTSATYVMQKVAGLGWRVHEFRVLPRSPRSADQND